MEPHYCIDESLSLKKIPVALKMGKFQTHQKPSSTSDKDILNDMAQYGHLGVWVTCDLNSRYAHLEEILASGISVAWVQANHASAAKRLFLVYSFVYRYHSIIANADEALYFDVRERLIKDIPSAFVKKISL